MTIHAKPAADSSSKVIDYAPSWSLYRTAIKRVFDLLFVFAAAPVVLPVVALLALLVALDGQNPFFLQNRVGKNGKVFRMVKLRSMVVDAEARLIEYLNENPAAKREWDERQKLSKDPRITLVGRIIRKTSLDELPQFFNVFMGDMSVVGPRPMMPAQREMYPGQAYYALKPGVTGFWQIGDRHSTSFADRARYDADYYREMSLWTDIVVVLKTVKVVLTGTGA